MSRIEFSKWHGLGNDFVVIDSRHQPVRVDGVLCRKLADRRRGVGCDQVMLIEQGDQGQGLLAAYRIFNTDGSAAEQCGNGARCVGRYLAPESDGPFKMSSPAGVVEVEANARDVSVSLPAPNAVRAERLNLNGDCFDAVLVDLGNPHGVIAVDDVGATPLDRLGKCAQGNDAFERGVNLGIYQLIEPGCIRLRVYERGVGETPACGSGACAAAVAARHNGHTSIHTVVHLPGGTLVIDWHGEGHALTMTGPAQHVFDGVIEL